jgi:hypothetical protein
VRGQRRVEQLWSFFFVSILRTTPIKRQGFLLWSVASAHSSHGNIALSAARFFQMHNFFSHFCEDATDRQDAGESTGGIGLWAAAV